MTRWWLWQAEHKEREKEIEAYWTYSFIQLNFQLFDTRIEAKAETKSQQQNRRLFNLHVLQAAHGPNRSKTQIKRKLFFIHIVCSPIYCTNNEKLCIYYIYSMNNCTHEYSAALDWINMNREADDMCVLGKRPTAAYQTHENNNLFDEEAEKRRRRENQRRTFYYMNWSNRTWSR